MELIYGYNILIDSIKNFEVNRNDLEDLKLIFQHQIGSVRRFALIRSLDDLLDILERRDVINEYDVSALEEIANVIGSPDIMLGISQYEPPYPNILCNKYALQRHQQEQERQFNNLQIYVEEPEEAQIYPRVPPVQSINFMDRSIFDQKRQLIYRYICDNIGRKWRAFGRELEMLEGEMDDLDQNHVGNAKERNRKMLQIIEEEERVDPRKMPLIICNALKESGRDDMRYHIEQILSR